jgi:hypothetical protein
MWQTVNDKKTGVRVLSADQSKKVLPATPKTYQTISLTTRPQGFITGSLPSPTRCAGCLDYAVN